MEYSAGLGSVRSPGLTARDLWVVAGLFAASRLLYAALGLQYDSSTFPGYMQFIDPELLANRLLESLWYYHANPPLLNFFAGVGIKLFAGGADVFFATAFHVLGLLVALCVYSLTFHLSNARAAAIVATGLLVFSPAFVLYENWFMYTFPAAALLTFAAFALLRYAQNGRTRYCATFFSLLALLLLTRSLFHLAWMLLVATLLAVVSRGRWRQVLYAAALPVLLVSLWYGKNYYYFGTFSSSSWMGLGLSNITTLVVSKAELEPLVAQGTLSRFALISRYRQTDALFAAQELPATRIAVLDQVKKTSGQYNFNNQCLVAVNRAYAADALAVARHFPASYVIGLIISNRLFFSPTSMNLYFSARNRAAALPMESIFNPLLYGVAAQPGYVEQPHFGFSGGYRLEVNTSFALIALWILMLGYGYAQARKGVMAIAAPIDPRAIVWGFFVVTAIYLYAVGTALELGENYRYRFLIEPLFIVMMATALTALVRKFRGRRPGLYEN